MPFLTSPFDYTATMKPIDGYTNAQNDALERALQLIAEALNETKVEDFGTMTAAELNDWYEKKVGYRPQVDDPSMSETDLRELCLSYWEASTETSEEMLP